MKDRDALRRILPREIVRMVGIGGLAVGFWWGKTAFEYQSWVSEQANEIYAATYPSQDDELPKLPEFLEKRAGWAIKESLNDLRRERLATIKKEMFGFPADHDQLLLFFGLGGLFVAGGSLTLAPGSFIDVTKGKNTLPEQNPSFPNAVRLLRQEWGDEPPDEEERKRLEAAIGFLPPVGGKVMTQADINQGKTHPRPLSPTLTAEEQVAYLIQNQQQLGERYIYQMTVQGLLPDRFKYAALALILTNPHQNDWSQNMFVAPWGTVAPLVHDGGNVQTDFTSRWQGVSGRTDFLMRVVTTFHPDLEKVDIDSRDDLQRAQMEIMERGHLLLQAKAYQRLALALHCFLGTAPDHIGEDKRKTLASYWGYFQEQMEKLLAVSGTARVAEVPWFADVPLANRLGAGRYEADWPPVRRHLIHLEEVRWQHPEMIRETAHLLAHVTNLVDQEIGLISQQ